MIADEEKRKRQQKQYKERYDRVMQIITNKERRTWNVKDYRTSILLPLKQKSDGPLPLTLTELSNCYDEWKDRINGEIERSTHRLRKTKRRLSFLLLLVLVLVNHKNQLIPHFLQRHCCRTKKNPVASTVHVYLLTSVTHH
mmetsp:Transcript_5024/g.9550  ORF Transcript_5024/g.9550 Transcript_5024/m.9550 type:complete len:141 (-) Transcript_5024:14-436(-)